MTKPLLLLDVDGPLNPWALRATREGYTAYRMTPHGWTGRPLNVRLSPAHGPMLLDFAATHGVELVWATTWAQDANTMIGPRIGLPELPVIDFGGGQPGALPGWKYQAVAQYASGRPLAWFDDDFAEAAYIKARWRFEDAREGVPTLLHDVDPTMGLTQVDLDTVAEWVKTL